MKILLVEDDIIWQAKMQQMLDDLGYENMILCDNLVDAEQLIIKTQPNLIISDVMLGNTIIFDLFKNETLNQLHFIFITNSESTSHYNLSKSVPNSLYLVKPFHKISLAAAIDKLSISILQNLKTSGVNVRGAQNEKYFLKTEQIVFVKAELNYCIIKTLNNQFAVKKSLVSILNELGSQMLQIHRSIIVNKAYITKVLMAKNEIQTSIVALQIGRQYRQNVMDFIADTTKI